jgi:hypothetical protein
MVNISGIIPQSHIHALDVTSLQDPATAGISRKPVIPVRTSSQSLVRRERGASPQNEPTRVSIELRNRAANLAHRFQNREAPLLQMLTEQMAMEGEVLKMHASMPYEELAGNLHEDLHAHHGRENMAMDAGRTLVNDALTALFGQQGELDAGPIKVALDTYAQGLAEHLSIGHSRYEEVLAAPNLNAKQKVDIERSRDAFIDHAIRVGTEIPRMLEENFKKTASSQQQANHQLAASQVYVEGLDPGEEHTLATAAHEQHQAISTNCQTVHAFMTQLKDDYNAPEAFADALHNARLPAILDQFDLQRSWQNKLRTRAPAALAQGIASALHFGGTRSSIEQALSGRAFATRVSAAGVGLGIAHEVVNNSIRPAAQEVMGALGGMTVRLVKPNEVIAKPLHIITVNGERHERSEQEFAEETKALKDLETKFILEQNKHKFGTPQGEIEGFQSFGIFQTALEGLVAANQLPEKSVLALMVASALGGIGMVDTQIKSQLNATVKNSLGRELPTHLPKAVVGTLAERMAKVGRDGVKALDIRQRAVQEAVLSKVFGSIQGIAVSTGAAYAVRYLAHDTPRHITTKLLVSALGPTLTLSSFFAAMQTKPEATKGGTGRVANAVNNLLDPDRHTLPHTTQAGSAGRVAENTFHRVRGALQLPSQAAVEVTAAVAQLATKATNATVMATANAGAASFDATMAASRSFRDAMRGSPPTHDSQQDIELGERNPAAQPA